MTTTLHSHVLAGCAPSPLAHYLKGLGVLRLVAEQADPTARGAWRDERFVLWTRLDREALLTFFLERYAPTPMLDPWNKDSYSQSSRESTPLDIIRASRAARLEPFRQVIKQTDAMLRSAEELEDKEEKARFLRDLRNGWRGPVAKWLGAVTSISTDGGAGFPAVLGSGGVDGRLDFANNVMQRLVELFDTEDGMPRPRSRERLVLGLFGDATKGLETGGIGQFHPGAVGGPNSTTGFDAKGLVNPWDFVLMLEGACVLTVSVVRRLDSDDLPVGAAPFAVRSASAGYGSASRGEKERGEVWLPIWPKASSLSDVHDIFRHGRLQLGHRRATRAIDAARALARLGVDRGIQAFERFCFLQRKGKDHLAVPIGRWSVRWRAPAPRARLLDELDDWIDRVRRAASDRTAPASFGRLARRLDDDVLAVCRDDSPERWENLLRSLAITEDELVRRGRTTAERGLRPLPPLSPEWLDVLRWGDAEVRLAAALGSARTPYWVPTTARRELGTIRAHCLPLDPKGPPWSPRFDRGEAGLRRSPRVVWRGMSLWEDLAAVALRRALESKQEGLAFFALAPAIAPRLEHLSELVFGRIDGARVSDLGRALMALRWDEVDRARLSAFGGEGEPTDLRDVPAILQLVLLACAPRAELTLRGGDGNAEVDLPKLDTATLRLLHGGRVAEAVERAARRLRAAGVPVKFERGAGGPDLGRRLLAALALSPGAWALGRLHDQISRPQVPPAPAGEDEE